METKEVVDGLITVLTVVGGSALFSAFVPLKFVRYLGPAKKILEIVSGNFLNAKNKDDGNK